MVLVGLGVDERAPRHQNFLAETGVPIQLLTFHAFQAGVDLFLAKQVESEPVTAAPSAGMGTKEGNRKVLQDKAAALGVADFLEEAARFVNTNLGNAYVWPYKTIYSFNVADETAEGRATQRYIVSLGPNDQRPGTLKLAFPERVLELDARVEPMLVERLRGRRVDSARHAVEVLIEAPTWSDLQGDLAQALQTIRRLWDERRERASQDALRTSDAVAEADGVPAHSEAVTDA
jgi:hypothetical protein